MNEKWLSPLIKKLLSLIKFNLIPIQSFSDEVDSINSHINQEIGMRDSLKDSNRGFQRTWL